MPELNVDADGAKPEAPCDLPKYEKSKRTPVRPSWIASSLFLVAAAATAAGVLLLQPHTNGRLAPALFVIGAFFFISAVAVQGGIAREKRIEAEENDECEQHCAVLRQALNRIEDCTLKGLAYVNFRQIRVFTVIAQRQARMSYYASLTAAAISLFVLLSGVAVSYGLTATPAKITAASLAVVGSALSAFLATTFLKTYAMASQQMSYYYGQPLVHCYLLHAEWLASMANEHVGEGADPNLWNDVIKASINASVNAQKHLLNIQEASFADAQHRNGKPAGPAAS